MADWIYLDHGSSTPSHLSAMRIQKIKEQILTLFGFESCDQFYLSSGSFENHSHLLFSHYIDFIRETGRTHILSVEKETPTILKTIKRLEKFEVQGKILPINEKGSLTKRALEEAIKPRSSLLSISLAHPLTGVIQPIAEIAEVCHNRNVRLHVDMSAALGKVMMPFGALRGISFLTFEAGDFGGLIARRGEKLEPIPVRSESAHVKLIDFLNDVVDKMDHMALETQRLKTFFETRILERIPEAKVLMRDSDRLPNCFAIGVEGIHAENLLFHLQRKGLTAAGAYSPNYLSFSLCKKTTQEEIERSIEILVETVEKLKPLTQAQCIAKNSFTE